MKRLSMLICILILTGCQSPRQSSSSLTQSLNSDNPEQQAWQFLRSVEQTRPDHVNTYRVCHINQDNSVSDTFHEQGKSFMDGDVPAWQDGETISTVNNPKQIKIKLRTLGAMWAVQMVFHPTSKHRCEFNPQEKDNLCNPSWCNLTIGSGKLKPAEKDDYLNKIATAAKSIGMQVSYE
ncbi:hypothetical protein [Neptunicella sp.]|uniref:hypothetical protein n=1 Tax=Neptunicella sp. TaxID=2125986 RepID=UPI003F6918B5